MMDSKHSRRAKTPIALAKTDIATLRINLLIANLKRLTPDALDELKRANDPATRKHPNNFTGKDWKETSVPCALKPSNLLQPICDSYGNPLDGKMVYLRLNDLVAQTRLYVPIDTKQGLDDVGENSLSEWRDKLTNKRYLTRISYRHPLGLTESIDMTNSPHISRSVPLRVTLCYLDPDTLETYPASYAVASNQEQPTNETKYKPIRARQRPRTRFISEYEANLAAEQADGDSPLIIFGKVIRKLKPLRVIDVDTPEGSRMLLCATGGQLTQDMINYIQTLPTMRQAAKELGLDLTTFQKYLKKSNVIWRPARKQDSPQVLTYSLPKHLAELSQRQQVLYLLTSQPDLRPAEIANLLGGKIKPSYISNVKQEFKNGQHRPKRVGRPFDYSKPQPVERPTEATYRTTGKGTKARRYDKATAIKLIADGLTTKEICKQVYINPAYVRKLRSDLKKLTIEDLL